MKRVLLVIFVLSFVGGSLTAWYLWHDMQTQLDSPINISADQSFKFTIKPGMHLKDVADALVAEGLIAQPYHLIIEGRLQKSDAKLKAGEYLLTSGTSQRQLLKQFEGGKVVQYSLTLIEGWSFKQVMETIRANDILVSALKDFDQKTVMEAIGQPNIHPEGRFYPDTYHFPTGMTDVEFLQRAYLKMEQVLAEEWHAREADLPYQTPDEALTMASIIEKETGAAEERATIAGVFVRRLNKGMKLQTDPTVIYAMGDEYQGNIRRKDLKRDSPYNTYFYAGLPPTPIAMPGRDAIHAALHPEPGETLYFVAKGNGKHYFSKTLQEHNRAVRKYQLGK